MSELFDPLAPTSKSAEVDLYYAGRRIGLTLILRSPESKEVKAARKKYNMKTEDKKKLTTSARDAAFREFLAGFVEDWLWDDEAPGIGGEKPEFSEKSMIGFLSNDRIGGSIGEQILEQYADVENFLDISAND